MSYASERPSRSQAIYDRDSIEARRKRAGISVDELSKRAQVPYTRLFMILSGRLKPDEVARINHALETVELARAN